MERFDRQGAIYLMNEARKKDDELQKTLDEIYSEIVDSAREGYGAVTYGPIEYSLAARAASFFEEKEFIIFFRCVSGGYNLEIIWEEGY